MIRRHTIRRPSDRRALTAPARPSSRTVPGLASLALTACALGVVGITAAAFTDHAELGLGTGSPSSGVGYLDQFDIGVVLPDGTVEQADGPDGYDWVVKDAETLLPGHSITTTIPVFNNTPTLNADVTVEIVLRNGDGKVADGVPNITELLRFTAKNSSGDVLFSNASWADAQASLAVLTARGGDALAQGDTYVAGPADSSEAVTLTIDYPDVAGVEDYNGGQSAFALRFAASSVKP